MHLPAAERLELPPGLDPASDSFVMASQIWIADEPGLASCELFWCGARFVGLVSVGTTVWQWEVPYFLVVQSVQGELVDNLDTIITDSRLYSPIIRMGGRGWPIPTRLPQTLV